MIENLKELTGAAMPIAVDAVVVLIILIVALIHGKKGLYESFMPLVVIILSLTIGFSAANYLTPIVEPYAWPHVENYIEKHIDKFATTDSIEAEVVDGDVDYLEGGDNVLARELKVKLAEVALIKAKLVSTKVVHAALLIVCTLLAWLILSILRKLLGKITDWSVIGWVNKTGGFIVGACEATLLLVLLSRIFNAAGIHFINDYSEGTAVLKWICSGDVNAAWQDIKNLNIQQLKEIDLSSLKQIDYDKIGSDVHDLFSNIKQLKL